MQKSTLQEFKQRRHTRILRTSVFSFVGIIAGAGFLAISLNRIAPIRAIVVEGIVPDSTSSVTAVISAAIHSNNFLRQNLFFVNTASIDTALHTVYPELESVEFRRSFTSKALTAIVRPRTRWAYWCINGNDCYSIDRTGVAFASATTTDSMLVIRDARAGGRTTILNHRVLNDREIRWIDALIAALTQQNLFSTQLVISADSIYTLTTRDGWSLIADLSADPAVASTHIRALLASLSTPVRSRLEYIDLRFNDRGFYKIR